jgi:DNA-binding CsgD family transcriptional regulator
MTAGVERGERGEIVRGERELALRAGHLFAGVREEFTCAAAGLHTWSRGELRAAILAALRPAKERGVAVRKVFHAGVLDDPEAAAHVRRLAGYGIRVRLAATELPQEMIMIDRRTVILAEPSGPPAPTDRTYTVLRDGAVVAGLATLFEATWQAATDLVDLDSAASLGPRLDAPARDVLAALRDGLTDEAAARRLGLSVRTYRRRVADLMTRLDARSRFQAGARAGELGL